MKNQLAGKTLTTSLLFILLALPAALWTPSVVADDVATRVTLGTATRGGGFQLYGQHLADTINNLDQGLDVEALATGGSRQNIKLLVNGDIQLGLVEGNAAHQVLGGDDPSSSVLKILSVMYPNPGMFVVRADSAYRSIEDLQGKPIAFGTRASGLRILAADVLDGLGLDPQKDFGQVILERAADGPRLLLENRVEALWGAGIGWPGFVTVANSPSGARFIAPSPEQLEKIRSKHGHLKPMSVPAGTYRGQSSAIDSVGLWSLVLVRADVPESLVYRLAQALHRGEASLAKRLEQGRYTRAENTLRQVSTSELHPGVLKYFYDQGLLEK